ncbi:hypothetical protein E2562_009681 [Oryza meyeriana var. granulata]|uniref:Uncharacterized protein n=1 Tax=Oryza meyeriana var. granulata TaxID=110450 RepID=A0A6G1D1P1_9ORYZ|nr:hypothetical protein E2562_009681 [Oryza meyeriana var. granulata]
MAFRNEMGDTSEERGCAEVLGLWDAHSGARKLLGHVGEGLDGRVRGEKEIKRSAQSTRTHGSHWTVAAGRTRTSHGCTGQRPREEEGRGRPSELGQLQSGPRLARRGGLLARWQGGIWLA